MKSMITESTKGFIKRIWAQGKKLDESGFNIGTSFIWTANKQKGTMRIIAIKDSSPKRGKGRGRVSSKIVGKKRIPIIDINNMEVLETFNGCSKCKITFGTNEIIVEKISEDQTAKKNIINTIANKVLHFRSKERQKANKVIIPNYMLDIMNVVRRKVAGLENQISIFDFEDEITKQEVQALSIEETDRLEKTYSLLSTFSGMGGFDLGFISENIIPQFAIDYSGDKTLKNHHINTYKHNIGNHIVDCDISRYDFKSQQVKEAFPNGVDVLIGGPPCQDYSMRNKNSSFYTRILETPKNKLIFHYIRAIRETNPLIFVMENVKEILLRGKEFINVLKLELGMLGYEITTTILKGKDLGMAQQRQRAILIGSRIGKINIEMPIIRKEETVEDVLNSIALDAPNQDYLHPRTKDVIERLNLLKPGQSNQDLPERLRCNYKSIYEKLTLRGKVGTIDNVGKKYLQSPTEPRVLTLREAMAFQGFPNNFKIIGDSLWAGYQMIANAVPVQFSKVIAKSVRKALDRYYRKQQPSM